MSTGEDTSTSGFTLLEIMVVLAIAAMLIAIAAPSLFAGRSGAEYKAAVTSIASGLRNARNTALFSGRETTFTLDVQQRAYQVGANKAVSLPQDVHLVLHTAEAETQSDSRGAIRFYPDGSSTGGYIAVSPEPTDGVSSIVPTRVSVDWLTGRVAIDK